MRIGLRDSGLPNDDNADRHCDVRMAMNDPIANQNRRR